MIKLMKNKKIKVLKKVKIKDDCWNKPGFGYLNPGTIIEVIGKPTEISDVAFKVIEGSGKITHRHINEEVIRDIKKGSIGFFFLEGHNTNHPYDYGTLSDKFFEDQQETKN